jgi:nucleotide-binding universal stress UspA family protein
MANPRTFLVPVTTHPASLEAVAVAAQMAKASKGKVFLVHVIEVLRSLPLNADMQAEARRGEQILRRGEEISTHIGFNVNSALVQARDAGQAIVEEARDRGVDCVVLGVPFKRVIGAYHVGPTAEYVMKNATCHVWLIRQGDEHPAHTEHA